MCNAIANTNGNASARNLIIIMMMMMMMMMMIKSLNSAGIVGSISAISRVRFPEQRLVIEPTGIAFLFQFLILILFFYAFENIRM